MTNQTTTAFALSEAQQQRLSAILDTVLPASDDGGMPSAGGLDFLTYLREQAEDFMPTLGQIVDNFDDAFSGQALSNRLRHAEDTAQAARDPWLEGPVPPPHPRPHVVAGRDGGSLLG